MKTTLKAALLLGSALVCTPVLADQPRPPEYYTVDARGVDLVSGGFVSTAVDAAIGAGGAELTFARVSLPGGWRDVSAATITITGNTYIVSLEGVSREFVKTGSTFTPKLADGSSFVQSSANAGVYTSRDGVVAEFAIVAGQNMSAFFGFSGYIKRLRRPDGRETTFNWGKSYWCSSWEDQCYGFIPIWRLEKIENNSGYAIAIEYALNDALEDADGYVRKTRVVAYNAAVDSCGASNAYCRSNPAWSATDYTYAPGAEHPRAVTDNAGRTTTYTYAAGSLSAIRLPGSAIDDVSIQYQAGKVSQVAGSQGVWTYGYVDAGANRTTTADGPLGQKTVAVTNLNLGRAASVTTAGHTQTYSYDEFRRLTRATNPEGDYTELTYDVRGNVTQTVSVPKTGSGLPSQTASATFPSTCVNSIICNLPTTTTDARGGVTDYTYDAAHGGLLTVTGPSPAIGAARPQTRIGYTPQTAYYRNSAGAIVAAASAITLPSSVSSCAVGVSQSCVGTANETLTTIVYGSAGVANNLLPTVVTQRDGTGTLAASTTTVYTPSGNIASVDGPLAGSEDATYYRYDNARRLVGVAGPDPDGAGSLQRRAQRLTYDARGSVVLAEQGVVAGVTDANWAAFASLRQTAVAYDGYGRLTQERVQAAGETHNLVQVSYDAAGRQDCVTTRMNPQSFAAPPASACALAATGAFGPDRITKYGYDAAGQLTSTISGYGTATTVTESATYTANGKPLTLTDGAGNVSTMVYDGFDRLSRMRYPNASGGGSSTTDYEEYGYDAASNVVSYRNRGGETLASGYDALNRQATLGGAAIADRSFSYDLLGRLTGVSYAGGGAGATRTWDALGRQTSEAQNGVGTVSYGYDAAGRRTSMSWPDGFYVAYDYNWADDLTAVRENGATDWQLASWAYDNLGRRIAQGRGNGATTYWTYDGVGRLAGLTQDMAGTAQDLTLGFTYNPAGQIVFRTVSNPTYAYTPASGVTSYVNNGRNQVTAVGGAAVGYDVRQNITSAPMGSYGYNGAGELTSATVGGATTGLSYDPAGRLYQVGATRFLYDGVQAIGEYDTSSNVLKRYVPGLGLDNVIAAYEGAGYDRRWLQADERGSVVSLADGSGAAVSINTYDEYGVPGAGNAGRFQYTGQMWLPQAQLYHYRARAYAPTLGRFMQTDPIGYGDGANLYGYVSADPVNGVDPTGLAGYSICYDSWVWVAGSGNGEEGQFTNIPSCTYFSGGGDDYGSVDWGSLTPGGSIYDGFPGAGFSGPPIEFDPNYAAYSNARAEALHNNRWMIVPVVAPFVAVPAAHYGSAALLSWLGNRAAASTPFAQNAISHTFLVKNGHMTWSAANQRAIQMTVQTRYFAGRNGYGVSFYARNTRMGQVWARVDKGAIKSGGVNNPSRSLWSIR